MARMLRERADLDEQGGEIILVVHWMGGVRTELRLPRRRRGQRNSTATKIAEAVRVLALVCSDDVIAGLLNRNGLRTGHGNRWTRERVTSLRGFTHLAREGRMTVTIRRGNCCPHSAAWQRGRSRRKAARPEIAVRRDRPAETGGALAFFYRA